MENLGSDAVFHTLHDGEVLPDTNQTSMLAIGITFSVIAIEVMALRIYCRLHVIGWGLRADDCKPHLFYIGHFLESLRAVVLTDDLVDLILVGVISNVG